MPLYHTQATADYINAQDPSRNIKVGDYSEDDDFSGISYSSIDPQGNYTVSNSTSNRPFNTSNTNPIRNLTEQDDNTNQFRFQGNAGLNFEIMKGLDFKTTQSIYFRNSARKQTGETNAARLGNPNYATYTNSTYSTS
jgi:hypothetical protein